MLARRSLPLILTSLALLGSCSSQPSPDELAVVEPQFGPAALERDAAIERGLELAPEDPRHAALVERLRRDGPAGLDALIAEYRRAPRRSADVDAAWRALIDAVAQQRDAHYGGLFWYRDMNEARAVAEASGKPILSLRLLGELSSEYSCANSRLFRTLLYADPELARWLERRFVLHWSSERPVPRLEIDFGDGRKLARTITGNSAHFVLDRRGRTIDVIPGLLAPSSFEAALAESLEAHAQLAEIDDDARWRAALARFHREQFSARADHLSEALAQLRGTARDPEPVLAWLQRSPNPTREAVPARAAVPMAVGKAAIEAPILAAAPGQLGGPARARAWVEPSDAELVQLGARETGELRLHPNSEAIIANERPLDALVPARERAAAELALRAALLRSLQADTGKNRYELHARVHLELAARAEQGRSLGFADVDEWVYAELFETPASDPWLGLVDPTVYTGLADGGVSRD